jgi:hypothetical protein
MESDLQFYLCVEPKTGIEIVLVLFLKLKPKVLQR